MADRLLKQQGLEQLEAALAEAERWMERRRRAVLDSENDSLPEEFPVCPWCGAGGPGVAFGKEGWVVVMDKVIPRVDEEGGYIDDTECVGYEVLWGSYEPIIDGPYYCFQCHNHFNEFEIVSREEVVWKQMMESSSSARTSTVH